MSRAQSDICPLREPLWTQITARVPDALAVSLDAAAAQLNRSRAEVIRQALEKYVEDFDDLSVAVERLRDPSDPCPRLGRGQA